MVGWKNKCRDYKGNYVWKEDNISFSMKPGLWKESIQKLKKMNKIIKTYFKEQNHGN